MVELSDIEELRALAATMPPSDELSPLTSPEVVIGWIIAQARASGADETRWAEVLIRASEMLPDEVRRYERTLRRLGYVQVADMMRRIAGRRKRDLRPIA
jgi:hypothetical protein